MSRHKATFMESCLNGDVDMSSIDDFIDEWHDSPDDTIPLSKFLGFNKDEYALYVEQQYVLPYIISAHRFNIPISDALLFDDGYSLAARAKDASEAHNVAEWLRKTGRI